MSDTNIVPQQNRPPIVVLRERLLKRRGELQAALTDISVDTFIRALITSAQVNPELQACSFESLWIACMRACRDGLLPDGREGVIIPFRDRASWVPMVGGLLKRFRQSGQCRWVGSEPVRRGEKFERWIDQNGEHFRHVPEGDDNAPIEKVYACALTRDSGFYIAVLSMGEIDKIRKVSKTTRDDAPWKLWPVEMMRKTALKRLAKMLPSGRDLFEDEDEHPLSQPPQLAVDNERPPGAASALEQFAGVSAPAASEGDPAGKGDNSPAAPDALIADHYVIAYERGAVAKTVGAQRRAVPGEYRDDDNRIESEAWHAGYDGKSWTNPETGETLGPEAGNDQA